MSHTRTASRRTRVVGALAALACAAILAGCEEGPATNPTPDPPPDPPPKASPSLKAVYWIHGGGIQRADAAGRNATVLVPRLRPIIGMAVDGTADKLYWTSWPDAGYRIQRANLDGSGTEDVIVAESGPVLNSHLALDTANGKMYWTTSGYVVGSGTSRIQRANLDGSGAEELVRDPASAPMYAISLDAANGKMYWATSDDFPTSRIQRANLDGSGVEDFVTESQGVVFGIEVAEGQVFWTTMNFTEEGNVAGGAIRRARLSGTGVEDLVAFPAGSPVSAFGLDVVDGKVYWTTLEQRRGLVRGGQIRRANLDGTGAENLVTFPSSSSSAPAVLNVIDGRMYWTEFGATAISSAIRVADTDGSDIEDVIVNTGLLYAHGAAIALDRAAGSVYWTEIGIAGVRRANLDGTGVEDLIADATQGFNVDRAGIALDIDRGEMYWTESGDGANRIQRARFDGTRVEVVAGNARSPRGIALDLDSRKMYWTEGGGDVGVRRANLDGTGMEDLVSSDRDTRGEGIALDVGNGKIYWIEGYGTTGSSDRRGRIRRANLDGTAVENLIADQSSDLAGLALDVASGKMYWTETARGHDGRVAHARIRRASLDGSDVEVYAELDPAHASALGGIALDIR